MIYSQTLLRKLRKDMIMQKTALTQTAQIQQWVDILQKLSYGRFHMPGISISDQSEHFSATTPLNTSHMLGPVHDTGS